MNSEFARKISEDIEAMPALPSAAMKLIELTANPDTQLTQISQIISMDQTLAVRVLRVANSPLYGSVRKIGSIEQAVKTIGFQALKNITLSLSVMNVAEKQIKFDPKELDSFWKHSLATAIAAQRLAISLGVENPDEAFTAGLIHDIGKLVFMNHSYELYSNAVEIAQDGHFSLLKLERETFAVDHTELGSELCRHWGIPAEITEAFARHHEINVKAIDAQSLSTLAGIICVADQLSEISTIRESAKTAYIEPVFIDLMWKARFPISKIEPILLNLPADLKQIQTSFGLSSSEGVVLDMGKKRKFGLFLSEKRKEEIVKLLLLCLGLGWVDVMGEKEQPSDLAAVIDDVVLEKIGWNKEVFPVRMFKHWINYEMSKAK